MAMRNFSMRSSVFPVRGAYDFGGSEARFGAGRSGHSHQGQDVFAACGTPLVFPRKHSTSPPFCSKPLCRRAYARWRYKHNPEYRQRQIDGVTRRRGRGRVTDKNSLGGTR